LPFVRISRDKRGYEHFYLVHTTAARRGKPRQRILYWFRTPPNVRVGRTPFDESVMRAIEARNPDVTFDWEELRRTPMPPPSQEPWRERRRAEKVMRQSLAADDEAEPPTMEEVPVLAEAVDAVEPPAVETVSENVQPTPDVGVLQEVPLQTGAAATPAVADSRQFDPRRRRRRRRGRRGRPEAPPTLPGAMEPVPADTAVSSSTGTEPEALSREDPGDDEGE
jgi:hypothetical protein